MLACLRVRYSPSCITPVRGLASTKATIALAALALASGRTVVGLAAALTASFSASAQSPTFILSAILPFASLATVIHSLNCPLSPSRPSFLRAVTSACRIVCWDLHTGRGVGHHAPSISLRDLGVFIKLSLQSHRHLRTFIIDSIVGEICSSTSNSFVRDPVLV
jgi:hypothetical protein